ncbi:hypothetical protein [Elizabethkingia meningoseptica]|uniref:hypothetical protein n=1 Tax=Elizabethkingia meningoseptica TaxID=238 RepID=UPI0016283DA0|nr:hypothetical protein [Elizabethkingia meningoseptica]MDE5432990.1 hypothetical protein [Elizabethkingia meningoseptica]HAY3553797.1 hypothetical protein [Elizabethkingia meningoseptica]
MKTKYVKVPVSDRLPEKEEEFLTSKGELYFSIERKQFETYKNTRNSNPSFWLEEKEDHSEEMLSLLEDVKLFFQPHPHFAFTDDQESTLKQIEELINKINNGKI